MIFKHYFRGQVRKYFHAFHFENTNDFLPGLAVAKATSLRLTKRIKPPAGEVLCLFCAGWGNRTPDKSLENSYFATKLIPRFLPLFVRRCRGILAFCF